MLSILESNPAESSEKLFNAIRTNNMQAYIDEIVKTGEMYIPESLPTLRRKISEELLGWKKNFYEIPSASRYLTGLTLYYYFLHHADMVPENVIQWGLESDEGFTNAISTMMITTEDRSTDVLWAQRRFGAEIFESSLN